MKMFQHLAQHQYRTMFYQNLANHKTMELTISPFGKFWLKQPRHDKPGDKNCKQKDMSMIVCSYRNRTITPLVLYNHFSPLIVTFSKQPQYTTLPLVAESKILQRKINSLRHEMMSRHIVWHPWNIWKCRLQTQHLCKPFLPLKHTATYYTTYYTLPLFSHNEPNTNFNHRLLDLQTNLTKTALLQKLILNQEATPPI